VYMGGEVRCKRCRQMFLLPAASDSQPIKIYDGIRSAPSSDSQQPAGASSDGQRTGTPKRGLLDQLNQFIATYDELRLSHDQLRIDHTRAETDRDEAGKRLKNATEELNTIRAQLGTIAPSDVRGIASERDGLSAEVQRLRDVNVALAAAQSKGQALIAELERRVLEIVPLRKERDTLTAKVKRQEGELSAGQAERSALANDLSTERAALVAANTELHRVTEQLEQSAKDLSAARREREQTKQLLDDAQNDLSALQAENARVTFELQNASATIERLTKSLAERDKTVDQFNTELERVRAALSSAERTIRDEREKLATELNSLSAHVEQLRQKHQSAESLSKQLESRNAELTTAHEQLGAEYKARLESERMRREELVDEILQLRADSEETDRAIEELITTTLRSPIVPAASPDEVDVARIKAGDTEREHADTERRNRLITQSLQHAGIHINVPGGT
jgi:chromosome segregation ATPase